MLAAYHGHASLVQLLIRHGADPNRVNDRGQSPLAGAVFKGEAEVIEVCTLSRGLSLTSLAFLSLVVFFGGGILFKTEHMLIETGIARRRRRPRPRITKCHGSGNAVQARGEVEGQV